MSRNRPLRRFILQLLTVLPILFAGTLYLTACDRGKPWQLTDINGLMPTLHFKFTNDEGKPVRASNYHGKIALLYFGYTHCPDICPMTLGKLSLALKQLGPEMNDVRVLFVSVDPKRDTVPVLHRYVKYFGPEFVGLRGDNDMLRELTKRYRVTYSYGKPDAKGDYEVTHSSAVFVFGPEGKPRLMIRHNDQQAKITHDLRRLIGETIGKSSS
ncbi:MAG: SCO family protein [Gammaproteobacteria bacterium]|jgi:protein SCO1/2